ncbi:hypothetical protein L226DRAFT_562060 [Lentinus tigrinus ALCF2SS1-7]|uniref:uncharacterized protein n=1 Tax=Lentinus tigrinus ALCF2SS1-7 TaxID=1328758 RepID=UPI001165F629|nr:hypothetical protein L226DRAFT_562060 [Lentinus tigrinus ALCF2SS1-7]
MNEAELKALPRARLQKLAKSNGVKANMRSVDIIGQLLQHFNAQQANTGNDGGPNDTRAPKSSMNPKKRALRSKRPAPPDEEVASNADTEPVVPENAAPQAGPSRLSRRASRSNVSPVISGAKEWRGESASMRLSKRMRSGEQRASPVRTIGSRPAQDTVSRPSQGAAGEARGSASLAVLEQRAARSPQPYNADDLKVAPDTAQLRENLSDSDALRHEAHPSPVKGTEAPGGSRLPDILRRPTGFTPPRAVAQRDLGQRPPSAQPPVFRPIVVGERQGEPAFRGPVFTLPTAEDKARMQQNQPRGTSRLPNVPPRGPVFRPPSVRVARPQNVPRASENPAQDAPIREPSRAVGRTAVENTRPRGPGEHVRPTLEELNEILADLEDKSADYPKIAQEIARLQRVMGLLKSKETWMEDALKQVQRVRLVLEKHYMPKVKGQHSLLKVPMPTNQATREQRPGAAAEEENPFFYGGDVPSVPPVRDGKRKSVERDMPDESPPQKRFRSSMNP